MKLKIGHRLLAAREDRKLNQIEMAELLNLSNSAYARLERNETSADLDQLVQFSKSLNIPIQDFLPETITLNNTNNQNGQGGMILGNIYNYNYYSDKEIAQSLEAKDQENQGQKEKIQSLESKIKDLEESIASLKSTK